MVFSGSVIIPNNDFCHWNFSTSSAEDLQARMESSILAINYLSFSAKKKTTKKHPSKQKQKNNTVKLAKPLN